MTPNDRVVLKMLGEHSQEGGEWCCNFNGIWKLTKIDPKHIRLSCRRLRRKGLTTFHIGLMRDDGGLAGAGYCITAEGRKLIERLES